MQSRALILVILATVGLATCSGETVPTPADRASNTTSTEGASPPIPPESTRAETTIQDTASPDTSSPDTSSPGPTGDASSLVGGLLFEITFPDANRVATRVVRFEGVVEPGATVLAAGRYPANVDRSGAWSVTLVLDPGPNEVRFAATHPDGRVAEISRTVIYELPLTLRHDGLGAASFGDPVEAVLATLTDLLGPPDFDEIQVSPDVDRSVQWASVDLYLQFTIWDHFDAAGEPPHPVADGPVFHFYMTGAGLLTTDDGLGVGSLVADLERSLADVVYEAPDTECNPTWSFSAIHASGWLEYRIFGALSGDPSMAGSSITQWGAGLDRTPC